jgi:hypothetical protein
MFCIIIRKRMWTGCIRAYDEDARLVACVYAWNGDLRGWIATSAIDDVQLRTSDVELGTLVWASRVEGDLLEAEKVLTTWEGLLQHWIQNAHLFYGHLLTFGMLKVICCAFTYGKVRPVVRVPVGAASQILNQVAPVAADAELAAGDAGDI